MQEHPQARFIVDTLVRNGFVAYYAGGWVRDFLLQRESDDIDIATNASPEIIQKLFSHTVPIGIAFGIILVIIDHHQYEVATFRQDLAYQDGRRPTGVAFSTAEEDAKRRDFTINGMFYDPLEKKVLDFVEGQKDLEARIIRAIGNPHARIQEDRLRMIRAVRLACRFHFTIESATEKAIRAHAKELFPAVAIERIWQELTKGLLFNTLKAMLLMLHQFQLLEVIFPELENLSQQELTRRLEPVDHFPQQTPLICYLLELFPESSLQKALELCQFFKLSRRDREFTDLLFHIKNCILAEKQHPNTIEPIDWAYIYANPASSLCLQILAAHKGKQERTYFLEHHIQKISLLQPAINRIQNKLPLVTSEDLIALGIKPGKKMGLLLKTAEKISVNEGIQDKNEVLQRIVNTSEWKS